MSKSKFNSSRARLAQLTKLGCALMPVAGKVPTQRNWTTRDYPSADVVIRHCEKHNRNVGVRLPANVVVIDIDPRYGGDKGWDNLCLEYGIDESIFPCVITGSGGRHYYARKPPDV